MRSLVTVDRRVRSGRTRARRRPVIGLCLLLVVGSVAACQPAPTLSLTVTTAADAVDAQPGDGVCEATPGVGDCTLRAAVGEANTAPDRDEITIAPGVDPVLTRAGTNEDANATGDLDVHGELDIVGGGATIDAQGLDRVLDVASGKLTLRDLTVTGGAPVRFGAGANLGEGAGIRSLGDLVLTRVRVVGNQSPFSREGAGIWTEGVTVRISESEISGNRFESGEGTGGGLLVRDGTASLTRTLVADNDAEGIQGYGAGVNVVSSTIQASDGAPLAIYGSTATIALSTLSRVGTVQDVGAVVETISSDVQVGGSLLDASGAYGFNSVCFSPVTSRGHNVVSDASCQLGGNGDEEGVPVLLGPLADNGGPTRTLLPYAASPAADRIPAGTSGFCDGLLPVDQRGQARPDGVACDAGAVEGVGDEVAPIEVVVDDAGDAVDVTPGDRSCATGTGTCTLRAAVMEANATNPDLPGLADRVSIAPGIDPTLSLAGRGEDASATGDLDVTGALVLDGNGATIDGADLDRVLQVWGPHLAARDLTVTGGDAQGSATAARGGGIEARAPVELERVTLDGNRAGATGGGIWSSTQLVARDVVATANSAPQGGGIRAPRLDAEDITVAQNTASQYGGGLAIGGDGTLVRSTVAGNSATLEGGGIWVEAGAGPLRVTNSTVSGNSAPSASGISGGGFFSIGVLLIASTVTDNVGSPAMSTQSGFCTRACSSWTSIQAWGSILQGSPGQPACTAPIAAGTNLAPDGSCGETLAGDALLGPLADNGGPTLTHRPGAGSAAIDVIPVGTAGLCDQLLTVDQRGSARPAGAACDVGAVEVDAG